ncbi:hypothetical protein ZYGR_0A04460 [Zygosaccharomyces rouxii]|uniref:Porphobilinogen deaminase n=2 Tax=Zygosaccharomyces rouxii TaxID=4956 RepID=C5DQB2_ZYGRC|nr:uncharacterized protein ZYRO0A10098g [Zygosaccharomyces rouxii]KAH9198608.1 porphobilinogen deaminase, dipyromethane cofactor binding domain-containing protein [Zygosaccharomyces rouxii]GAV46848.1 hypothetical protein ZYGR_0A04460 [Zygosaccharomyces rouxii]CAR25873.1 ZYRO0A10098p [Zygosaccharomyces rouxii]
MSRRIRIGGRQSQLAIVQSELVKHLIEQKFPDITCSVFALQTLGDQQQSKPLYSFGGKALWTKELEDLLYDEDDNRKLDIIVHSLKDMPTTLPDGFELGGITERVDPSDCLVMPQGSPHKNLDTLPAGSVVGTSSVRRSAQLKRKYPHLRFESIRGNLHTRIRKLDDPQNDYQCIILASAGMKRLGLGYRITNTFDSSVMYHAVGQGALGIEIRAQDKEMKKILDAVCHKNTTVCCLAERQLMRSLEGGCSVPIGVGSRYDETTGYLHLRGIVVSVDGKQAVELNQELAINDVIRDSIECGKLLAEKMISNGARKILEEINLDKIDQ